MPGLPSTLQPGCYDAKAGDYYGEIAETSTNLQWSEFPVKVFLVDPVDPPKNWQQSTEQALAGWMSVFPLQLTEARESEHRGNLDQAAPRKGRDGRRTS